MIERYRLETLGYAMIIVLAESLMYGLLRWSPDQSWFKFFLVFPAPMFFLGWRYRGMRAIAK